MLASTKLFATGEIFNPKAEVNAPVKEPFKISPPWTPAFIAPETAPAPTAAIDVLATPAVVAATVEVPTVAPPNPLVIASDAAIPPIMAIPIPTAVNPQSLLTPWRTKVARVFKT